jgi:hypothetical protein
MGVSNVDMRDTHLVSDHDNIGEAKMWCGAEFVPSTESIAETTCLLCLKAAAIYGDGARERFWQITGRVVTEAF